MVGGLGGEGVVNVGGVGLGGEVMLVGGRVVGERLRRRSLRIEGRIVGRGAMVGLIVRPMVGLMVEPGVYLLVGPMVGPMVELEVGTSL